MIAATSRPRRPGLLVLLSLVTAVVWLLVLPRFSTLPAVQSRIERHERHGIDPAAMFYTDLEMFDARQQSVK